jgi:primosomal protein N' (replication factor Y)
VRKYFIQRIMLRPEKEFSRQALRKYLLDTQSALLADKRYAAIQIYYDVDPM